MLNLLLNQQNSWKIPESLDEGIKVANKTGETDSSQHDIAIVYGEKTTYILCVMSENCPKEDDAIDYIRAISRMVYNYLNIS
jgi:beta-lactamase class A